MKWKPGDICVSGPKYTPACYVIMDSVEGEPDLCLALSTKDRGVVRVQGEALVKIGEVSPALGVAGVKELLMQKPKPPEFESDEYARGNMRAHREAVQDFSENRVRWMILAKANPGDSLTIHKPRGSEVVTFHRVLERGRRFVFVAADAQGDLHRYPLDCLCLGPAEHGH